MVGNLGVAELPGGWDAPGQSADWGEEQDQMLVSACSENEGPLKELEAMVDADFIWQKAANLISQLIRE
jgi:hypothetical protein